MDFIKVYERIRESGMEAEWGTLNNGLPQISVRVGGIVRHKAFLDAAFNKIASNIRMVKIYSVENDGILYAFFEVQVLSTPEDFVQRLSLYANEGVRAIRGVAAFVTCQTSVAES